jgi:hypothetical protein
MVHFMFKHMVTTINADIDVFSFAAGSTSLNQDPIAAKDTNAQFPHDAKNPAGSSGCPIGTNVVKHTGGEALLAIGQVMPAFRGANEQDEYLTYEAHAPKRDLGTNAKIFVMERKHVVLMRNAYPGMAQTLRDNNLAVPDPFDTTAAYVQTAEDIWKGLKEKFPEIVEEYCKKSICPLEDDGKCRDSKLHEKLTEHEFRCQACAEGYMGSKTKITPEIYKKSCPATCKACDVQRIADGVAENAWSKIANSLEFLKPNVAKSVVIGEIKAKLAIQNAQDSADEEEVSEISMNYGTEEEEDD